MRRRLQPTAPAPTPSIRIHPKLLVVSFAKPNHYFSKIIGYNDIRLNTYSHEYKYDKSDVDDLHQP